MEFIMTLVTVIADAVPNISNHVKIKITIIFMLSMFFKTKDGITVAKCTDMITDTHKPDCQ